DGDQHEARERPPYVRDAHREEEAPVLVAEPEPERQGEHQRDPERRERELDVLRRLLEQEAGVVVHEAEGVDERGWPERGGDHDARTTRVHGVSTRARSTSSPSATSASATTSAPALRISVLKRSCSSATKIGRPSPSEVTNAATVAIEIVET